MHRCAHPPCNHAWHVDRPDGKLARLMTDMLHSQALLTQSGGTSVTAARAKTATLQLFMHRKL